MPLVSRQYEIAKKIQSILQADTALQSLAPTWKIRKFSFARGKTWDPGYYVSPINLQEFAHESQQDEADFRFLVSAVDPQSEGSNVSRLEECLALIERVENIFRNRAGLTAPAGLRALNALYPTSTDGHMAFQCSQIEPAERFVAAALAAGFDVSATIVKVKVTFLRPSVSTLGS